MNRSKIYLSLAAILSTSMLTACGGSDSQVVPPKKSVVSEKTQVEGKLCIDQNINLACDTNEATTNSITNNIIPEAFRSTTHATLFELGTGGIYIAPPASDKISAYSTLVNNEILFNPTVNGSLAKAKTYLENLGIDEDLINAQEQAWLSAITEAISVAEGVHPYKAIAALVDKIIADNSNLAVSATLEEMSNQYFVKRDIQLSEEQVHWIESDHDERVSGLVSLPGRNLSVAATHYHNSLIVIDTAGEAPALKSRNLFAAVDAPRFSKDARTGASEHYLRTIQSSADGQHVYIAVVPRGEIGNAHDDTYGLFRVVVNDDGSFDTHNSVNTKRYANENIGKFVITHDNKVLVEDVEQEEYIVLNADLTETGERIALPSELDISKVYFSPDANYIYLVTTGDKSVEPIEYSKLHKYNRDSGTIEAEVTLSITSSLDGFVLFDQGKQALLYEENYYAKIIDLNAMAIVKSLPLSESAHQSIETAVVTADNRYAVLSGHDNYQLWLFDLNTPEVRMETLLATDSRISALSVNDYGKILAGGRESVVSIIDTTLGDVLTPEQAINADQAYLTKETINKGLNLSVIVSDLTLFTEIPAGANAKISWQTDNTAINVTPTDDKKLGAVTRDVSGDTTGTLTAKITYTFREETKSSQVDFDTNVRQAPAALQEQGTALFGGQFSEGYVGYIDVSPSGRRSVVTLRGLGGFNLVTRKHEDNSPEYQLSTGKTANEKGIIGQQLPAPYAYQTAQVDGKTKVINESRPVGVRFLDNDHVVIATPKATTADDATIDGALLVYNVNDASIASGEAQLIGTATSHQYGGTIKSLSHRINNRLGIIVEVTADDVTSYKAVIIDVSDPTNIQQVGADIKLANSASVIEVSHDGQAVFVAHDNKIAKYSSAGNGVAEHETSTALESLSIRSMAIGGSHNDTLFVGTSSGVASVYQFNTSDLTRNTNAVFQTGYFSRVQTIDVIGQQAYLSVWGYGVSVVDTQNQKELNFFEHKRQRRAGVSEHGEWIFAAQYISRSKNEIRVLQRAE